MGSHQMDSVLKYINRKKKPVIWRQLLGRENGFTEPGF